MSLDPAYLDYPRRREGYDHDLYPWSSIFDRAPVAWPSGARLAVWIVVSLEYFPLIPSDTPFRAPGHMATPYPDYRHYTARDYGTRVGIHRLLDAFAAVGVRVSVAANAEAARRNPELVERIVEAGHEIIAHSTDMNGTIATGLPEADEAALIAASLDGLEAATGTRPRGWLGIARSQSWTTPGLLRAAGVEYCCDWVNDELPWRFANGLANLPLNHELSDRQVIGVQQQSAENYAEQLCDAADYLSREAGVHGGRMLPIHLTPYISGLPYRIGAIEQLLRDLTARGDCWFARGDEILDAWAAA
ncbi:polysaccharide deacetylase family protein [Glacieibacterium frigidum]|uniref:Chitooligosaccharide deacetylase n=1 Tax=Glacieibacterium frigidum TaxID=2593303 RepID=A0A552UHM8_9SPHN|nr:polysaccharide deacetylase family protein [Glacieibacterium frigidum]TRW17697.1 polysaccharide deacetylase family protein [Glacieibacterium frigidum]